MLSLETRDDWTAATCTVTIGIFVDTFTPSSAVHSLYAWAVEFVAWFSAAARPWDDAVSALWLWRAGPSSGQVELGIVSNSDWTSALTGAGFALTGFDSDNWLAGVTAWGIAAAEGCVGPGDSRTWGRQGIRAWSADKGDGGGHGAVAAAPAGTVAARIDLIGALQPDELTWLAYCLRRARTPRRGRVWDALESRWINVAIGEDRRERRTDLTRVTLAAQTGPTP